MKIKNTLLAGLILLGVQSANASSKYNSEYVNVISSNPIYKTVNIRVPYEEVISKEYTRKVPCGHNYEREDRNSIGLDTIVGMGLGVAVGNQFGKGEGRKVAKVVGALLGAGIANNHRGSSYQTQYCNETGYRDEVITRYDYRSERKLQGYENVFRYKGQKYTKITNRPQKRIKVKTSISF
ncbi:glycine zipper 2TM domain-containing protein [Arcobacteraceae bacterium]|nr:glycine zipper 2TM domain-containing protein [Arcobacteraceae bacterium]